MAQLPRDARLLIAIRVIVVTTLLIAALIVQYTVRELLPISYLYYTAGLTYALQDGQGIFNAVGVVVFRGP